MRHLTNGNTFYLFLLLEGLVLGIFLFLHEPQREAAPLLEPKPRPLRLGFRAAFTQASPSPVGVQSYHTHPKKVEVGPQDRDSPQDGLSPEDGESAANALEAYLADVHSRVERKKRYPLRDKLLGNQGRVRVRFTLKATGQVSNIKILAASPYPGLNRSALRSIQEAQPFLPFPIQLSQKKLVLEYDLSFRLKE